MKYDDYINSARWRERREAFFFDHRRVCQGCRSRVRGDMELHHVSYENLGHENDEDLAALCARCHEEIHKRERQMIRDAAPGRLMTRAEAIREATKWTVTMKSSDTEIQGDRMALYTDQFGHLGFTRISEPRRPRSTAEILRRLAGSE